jgi:hypothetical protein
VTAIGTDHRALFYMDLWLMISVGLPRVPRYHSLPATLGVARARTPQTLRPPQAPPLAVIRLRAVFITELSQQAPLQRQSHRFCCVYERLPVELGHESP